MSSLTAIRDQDPGLIAFLKGIQLRVLNLERMVGAGSQSVSISIDGVIRRGPLAERGDATTHALAGEYIFIEDRQASSQGDIWWYTSKISAGTYDWVFVLEVP